MEKIKCDNCDWEWGASDAGEDPYTCHKCGHNNEPSVVSEEVNKMRKMMGLQEQGVKDKVTDFWKNKVKPATQKVGDAIKSGVHVASQKIADVTKPEQPQSQQPKPGRNLEQLRAEWTKINQDKTNMTGFGESVGQSESTARMSAQLKARAIILGKLGKQQATISSDIVDEATFQLENGNYDHLVLIKLRQDQINEEKNRMRKLHLEQSSLDGNRYNTIFSNPDKAEKFNKANRDLVTSITIDDTVDIISGLLDGIPGIGNAISAGIDVTHAIAYAVRFGLESEDDKKVEYGLMAFLTFATSSLPIAGNSINIVARKGVKGILRSTPQEILLLAKKLGIYNKTFLLLSKGKWRYSLLFALGRIGGSEIIEVVPKVVNDIRKLKTKIKSKQIIKGLDDFENLLIDFKEYQDITIPISKNLA